MATFYAHRFSRLLFCAVFTSLLFRFSHVSLCDVSGVILRIQTKLFKNMLFCVIGITDLDYLNVMLFLL